MAIAFGTVGIGKYVLDTVFKWLGGNTAHDRGEEAKLVQLRSDFEVHKAEDRKDITFIRENIGEIKADTTKIWDAVSALQAQIRFVASGSNNRVTELGREHHG